jgi:nitrogen fixation NifU-like protein
VDIPKLRDHTLHPRNLGEMVNPDGISVNCQDCGDLIIFYLAVKNDRITRAMYQLQGCGNLAACCSIASILAQGKTIWEAIQITGKQIEEALGGLPTAELHTSVYAADALYAAVQDYLKKKARKGSPSAAMQGDGWKSLYIQAQRQ